MEDINKKSFSRMVENYMIRHRRDSSYMDAVIMLCDQNEIDLRDSKKLLSKQIIDRIEVEAKDVNMVQGGSTSFRLDVDFC